MIMNDQAGDSLVNLPAAKPSYTIEQITALVWQAKPIWTDAVIGYAFPTAVPAFYGSYMASQLGYLSTVQKASAAAALRTWAELIPKQISETSVDKAQLLFFTAQAGAIGSNALAAANYPDTNGAASESGDVYISNGLFTESVYANTIASTMIHEVGHALGLSHPGPYNGCGFTYEDAAAYAQDSQQYSIMSYFSAASTGANHTAANGSTYGALTPLLHDIATIQWLYGVNVATRSSNTVYGFNSTAGSPEYDFSMLGRPPVETIWDGGGVDTIDLSGYTTASNLDLNEGAFSDVGGLTKNLSIAFGAMIENAIGGKGNDYLMGNALPNVLQGGAGNDMINGGDGVDTAVFSGLRDRYTIVTQDGRVTVTDISGVDGVDVLTHIEQLRFADQTVILESLASLPALSLRPVTILEGASGSRHTALIEVMLSQVSSNAVSFTYTTVDGNAVAGIDYVAATGSVTIAAGQTSALIPVSVLGDSINDMDKVFGLQLNALTGATASAATLAATGLVTIIDDDVSSVDDIGATAATARALPINVVSTSAINTQGDVDWFRVTLAKDGTYTMRVTGQATGGGTLPFSTLQIIDSSGAVLVSKSGGTLTQNTSGDTVLTMSGLAAGDYFVAVSSQSIPGSSAATTGSYTLNVEPSTGDDMGNTPLTAFVLGQTDAYENIAYQRGTINSASDSDWLQLRLTAGHRYEFYVFGADTNGGTLGASSLALYDNLGNTVIPRTDGGYGRDAKISFTAPATGTFYAAVAGTKGNFDASGTYLFWQHGLDPAPRDQLVLQLPDGQVKAWDASLGAAGLYSLLTLEKGDNVVGAGHVSFSPYGGLIVQKADGSYMRWSSGEGIIADWAGGGGWTALPGLTGMKVLGADGFAGSVGQPNYLQAQMIVAQNGDKLVFESTQGGETIGFGATNFGAGVQGYAAATLPKGDNFVGFIHTQGAAHSADLADKARPFQYADLLMRNPVTGAVSTWNFAGHQDYALSLDLQVVGIGNLTGGVAEDLLVYNTKDKSFSAWDMSAGASGFRSVALPAGASVLAVANIDGAGYDDILFQDTASHTWYWDGAAFHDLGTVLTGGVTLVGVLEGTPVSA
jgi:serralysin